MQRGVFLPMELLQEIMEYLSPSLSDLARCARVNRSMNECALAVLYRDINLYWYNDENDDEVTEKSMKRQERLLRIISERPRIGRFVHSFRDAESMLVDDEALEKSAMKNMKVVRHVELRRESFSRTILASIESYARLQSLSLSDLDPLNYIWKSITLSLTHLSWALPFRAWGENPWKSVGFIFKAVAATCPELLSLDISYHGCSCPDSTERPNTLQQYSDMAIGSNKLRNLQHLGFTGQFERPYGSGPDVELESGILDFIDCHKESLTSLTITVGGSAARERLDYVLWACRLLPQLSALALPTDDREPSMPRGYLERLTSQISKWNPLLERFSMTCIGYPFLPSIGALFKSWTKLKFLRLGDRDNTHGPFAADGRIDLVNYQPLHFIQQLPLSIEELYLVINGYELILDDDEDFDPICEIATEIFKSLRRLHTCDIAAWISNLDGGLGQIPEKAVHWRRLHHVPQPLTSPAIKTKDLWQSRMDSIYQEDDPAISHEKLVLDLEDDEGVFEGEDAKEIWIGGSSGPCDRDDFDRSWPWFGDMVESYPMYTRF